MQNKQLPGQRNAGDADAVPHELAEVGALPGLERSCSKSSWLGSSLPKVTSVRLMSEALTIHRNGKTISTTPKISTV